MGILIRVSDVTFSAPNLPVIQFPYEGITSGLISAYNFSHSAARSLTPIAGSVATPAVEVGSPVWGAASVVCAGGGVNGIDSGNQLGGAYTLYSVFRRSAGSAQAYGICASNASRAMRLAAEGNGWRAQLTVISDGVVVPVFSASDFAELDALTKDVTRFEFMAITVDPAATGGFGVWIHMPRVGYSKRRAITNPVTEQNPEETTSTVTFGHQKTSYVTATCEIAAGGHFNRALSQAEVRIQYQAVRKYCATVGIDI